MDDFYRFQYERYMHIDMVSIKYGCAVNLKGLMWYFGGSNYQSDNYQGPDKNLQVRFEAI